MFIKREIASELLNAATKYPVVITTGPRQSGKTIIARELFKNKEYISLEDITVREHATTYPRTFFGKLTDGSDIIPIEIKSTKTFHTSLLKSNQFIKKIYNKRIKNNYLICSGNQEQVIVGVSLINFKNAHKIKA